MHCVPDEPKVVTSKQANLSSTKKEKSSRKNRYSKFIEKYGEIDLPEIHEFEYLIFYLKSVGFYSSNGMGIEKLKSTELESWSNLTGIQLNCFEVETILQLSECYVYQYNTSKDPYCQAPYKTEKEEEKEITDQKRIQIANAWSNFARRNEGKRFKK